MALVLPKSVFLHVPKTGGEWVREAIAAAGIPTRESNRGQTWNAQKHSHLLDTTGLKGWNFAFRRRPLTWRRPWGGFLFAFVRNPLDWYRSAWAYKSERNLWKDDEPFDAKCYSDDFQQFVRNVLEHYPGHVSDLYELYTGREETGVISFVGRQESLAADLVKALRLANEKFDEKALLATSRVNVTAESPKWKDRCAYTPELEEAVIKAEERIMKRFGYLSKAATHA